MLLTIIPMNKRQYISSMLVSLESISLVHVFHYKCVFLLSLTYLLYFKISVYSLHSYFYGLQRLDTNTHVSLNWHFWLFTSPSQSRALGKGEHLYLVCCIYVPPTSSLLSCSVPVSTKRFHAPQGSHKPTDPVGSFPAAQHLEPSPTQYSLHLTRNKSMLKVKDSKEASEQGWPAPTLSPDLCLHVPASLLCSPPYSGRYFPPSPAPPPQEGLGMPGCVCHPVNTFI